MPTRLSLRKNVNFHLSFHTDRTINVIAVILGEIHETLPWFPSGKDIKLHRSYPKNPYASFLTFPLRLLIRQMACWRPRWIASKLRPASYQNRSLHDGKHFSKGKVGFERSPIAPSRPRSAMGSGKSNESTRTSKERKSFITNLLRHPSPSLAL